MWTSLFQNIHKPNEKSGHYMKESTQGFTLLEVLVSLTILSIIAIVAVKQVGEHQQSIANTAWQDEILDEGRSILTSILRTTPQKLSQRGTLAPEFPHVEWQTSINTFGILPDIQYLTMTLKDVIQQKEIVIEYILP